MSISPSHSEAARHNRAQSNGPTSDAGKARSSQNARKHNFFGSTALLTGEDKTLFDSLAETILTEFQPRNFIENRLVREMIDAEWRLQRIRDHSARIQNARATSLNPNPDLETAAEAFRLLVNEGNSLQLLLRYENQFRRQFDKAFEQLTALRRHEQTDRELIRRRVEEEQLQMIKQFAEAPVPECPPGFSSWEQYCLKKAAEAANSNPINIQNEPSKTASSPGLPKTGTES